MPKYVPSIAKNNELKEEFSKSLNVLIYKAERGRINSHIDEDEIKPIIASLKECLEKFQNALGTGQENVYDLYVESTNCLKALEKKFGQELVSEIEESADELIYAVNSWEDVLNGDVDFGSEDREKAKVGWSKKRLLNRLDELELIKDQFAENEKRLESEMVSLEKSEDEINGLILEEDNERRINELYRKITTLKSKKDSMDARRSNYSACFNLLDLIYANAKEMLAASDYSNVDLGKAKAFLNLGKLKAVMGDPDKAVSILRRMDRDISDIKEKTKLIDSRVFELDKESTNINSDALAYKEELMRKKREKEVMANLDTGDIASNGKKDQIKGEK